MLINLSKEHSLVSNWVAELRDVTVQTDRQRFRRNLERIGEVAAFEISRRLPYVEKEIQTPLGTCLCEVLEEQPVLTTILRAGLALHNGLLSYFDKADNAADQNLTDLQAQQQASHGRLRLYLGAFAWQTEAAG